MRERLNGLHILNTRPLSQGEKLAKAITEAGGVSISLPLIQIEATEKDWLETMPALHAVQLAIFVSVAAVEWSFRALKKSWPKDIQVFALGKGTAEALYASGVSSVHIASQSDSQHLLALPALHHVQQKTVLLFKGVGGLSDLQDTLMERKATLFILEVYKRIKIQPDPSIIQAIWQNNQVDIILITSEEILNHLFTLFPEHWLCEQTCLLVSERLISKARQKGIKHILKSAPETILETLITYSRTRS